MLRGQIGTSPLIQFVHAQCKSWGIGRVAYASCIVAQPVVLEFEPIDARVKTTSGIAAKRRWRMTGIMSGPYFCWLDGRHGGQPQTEWSRTLSHRCGFVERRVA